MDVPSHSGHTGRMRKPVVAHVSAEQLREMLDYNPSTGGFRWRYRFDKDAPWNGRLAGKPAGHVCKTLGYVLLSVDGRLCRAHRLAWLYMTGEWPSEEIDHINGDGLDNRFANLRVASRSQQTMNTRAHRDSASGLKGAYWDKRTSTWLAQIKHEGKQHYLGKYQTAEEAHAAYCEAARRLHGEFARTA
jgi:hypothetical protein